MHRSNWLGLLTGIASMAVTAPARTAAPAIPDILSGTPTAAQIDERCAWYSQSIKQALDRLEKYEGPTTVDTVLVPFDQINQLIYSGSGESTFWREVATTAEARDAAQKCEVAMSAEANKLSLSRPVFDLLKAIPAPADGPTALYLKRQVEAFERAGVALDDAGRAKMQQVSDEAAALSAEFEGNIPKGQKSITATVAELDGLPQDFIDAHKPDADGKVTITTDYTDSVPVLTYARSRALRERLAIAFYTRAYPQNEPVLRKMVNKRHELANLVGRPNYAALQLEDKMINSPDKVIELLDSMAAAARPAADRDYAKKLASLREEVPGAERVELWDDTYLGQRVQKALYSYDRQEARKYFTYDNVRDGILKLTEDMFGVTIRPWKFESWDKLVESYEVVEDGKVIGRFILDSHPRPGKYEHANAVPLRWGVGDQIPVGALVMNLPAGGHETGLMEHEDVITFLHEYGHLLHFIFGGQGQRFAGLSGFATEWDFIEAPSQMFENWVYDYDTLKRFAVDAEGNPIPQKLVEQMNRARYFNAGMSDLKLMGYANVSLRYYMDPAPSDLGEAFRRYQNAYDRVGFPEATHYEASLSHLGGYGPTVYTYSWSLAIADDLFTEFQKHGLRDPATAKRYRDLVLAPGGSKPAAELIADFLGRPVNMDAYKARMELDQ